MVKINLLPWREKARLARYVRFGITMGIALGITLFLLVLVHIYYKHLQSVQKSRTTYLQTEISEAQTQLTQMKKEKEQVIALEKQLQFVVGLRARSLRSIHLLDALEKTVPEGLSLEKIIREDNQIIILGHAQTDIQITLFLKNLESLKDFNQPVLTGISSVKVRNAPSRYFQLKIQQRD